MKLRVLKTIDVHSIVRKEFGAKAPSNLHAYLLTFNMICRKHRLAIVQADAAHYPELAATTEIELEL